MLLAGLVVSGCDTKSSEPDLFQYKNVYIGDNTAVAKILNGLPVTGYSKDFELVTTQPPYGIILNYDGGETAEQQEQIMVYTATYLFALIQNVDWIRYNFAEQQYTLSKERVQSWYAADLNKVQSAEELDTLINSHIDADKVKQSIK